MRSGGEEGDMEKEKEKEKTTCILSLVRRLWRERAMA